MSCCCQLFADRSCVAILLPTNVVTEHVMLPERGNSWVHTPVCFAVWAVESLHPTTVTMQNLTRACNAQQ